MNALGLDRIYVINVRAFEDRRRHVTAELARFGLEGEFVHEWDAEDITPEVDARYFDSSTLSRGQKSCALKHVAVLRRIVERAERLALVLEDDVVLDRDFERGVRDAVGESSMIESPHVVYIGSGGNFYTPRSRMRPGQRLYAAERGRFTDSYIIGASTARLRLSWIDSHHMSRPIDNEFDAMDRVSDVEMLWLEPPVVEQGSKNGLFQTVLEAAPSRPVQRLKFGWEKFRRKYLYQLWR